MEKPSSYYKNKYAVNVWSKLTIDLCMLVLIIAIFSLLSSILLSIIFINAIFLLNDTDSDKKERFRVVIHHRNMLLFNSFICYQGC